VLLCTTEGTDFFPEVGYYIVRGSLYQPRQCRVVSLPARPSGSYERLLRGCGLISVLTAPLWVYGLLFPFSGAFQAILGNNALTNLIVLLITLVLGIGLVQKASKGDAFLRRVMAVGLLFKLIAAAAFLYVFFQLYDIGTDSLVYLRLGKRVADVYSSTGQWTVLHTFWSTNFIVTLSAALQLLIGHSMAGLMILFAFLSFWGEYFLFCAFCLGFPSGERKLAALFIFLFPSSVFWTAALGKDAVVMFFIGLSCFGFARMIRQPNTAAIAMYVAGLAGVMLVRPHIALMIGISSCVPYLVANIGTGVRGAVKRAIFIPPLLLGVVLLTTQASRFLDLRDLSQSTNVLRSVGRNNLIGGSAFGGAPLGYKVVSAPFLLFRPFPWEAHNLIAAAASVEGICLGVFVWNRRRVLYATIKNGRGNPFAVFAIAYAVQFSIVFAAAITNFGLLTRQRVMLTPIALMLCLSGFRIGTANRATVYQSGGMHHLRARTSLASPR
jgi:hypothetical protein